MSFAAFTDNLQNLHKKETIKERSPQLVQQIRTHNNPV